jgi:hypothetical protein
LQQVTLPIAPLSKLVQIGKIVQTGKGNLVSKLPWAMFAASSLGKYFSKKYAESCAEDFKSLDKMFIQSY